MVRNDGVERHFKRVLVTGGAGFIGSNLVKRLRREHPEEELVVLDALTYAGDKDNLAGTETGERYFVQGDINDAKLVDELAGEVDAIINLAAQTHVDRSLESATAFVTSNVGGVSVLGEAALRHGHQLFLQVSTDEVYGEVQGKGSWEEGLLRPRNPYAASKAGGEMMAQALRARGLKVLVSRGCNTYGPFQHIEKLIPLLATNALQNKRLPLYGKGEAVRDYLYVEDHCAALDMMLHQAPLDGGVYNISTGREWSGVAVARRVLNQLGLNEDRIEFVRDRPGHDMRYAVDSGKLRALGWRPEVDFEDGLESTIAWYGDNQAWWRKRQAKASWTRRD